MATSVTQTIEISYPSIMKMSITSRILVSNSETLEGLKTKIFNDVWGQFHLRSSSTETHGSIGQVVLKQGKSIVTTDQDLRDRLVSGSRNFSVVFNRS